MTEQERTSAEIRLAQYGERTKGWSTATYNDGTEKALHEIALELKAELDRVRAQLTQVAAHVAKRAEYITAINNCHPDNSHDYWRWQGHAESRRQLAQQLGLPVAWPDSYEEAAS